MTRMPYTTVTASVVEKIDQLLAEGFNPAAISTRLSVSAYVVGVIAGDKIGRGRRPPSGGSACRAANRADDVDAVTIRRIQRMLAVGWLNREQIAHEAGVVANTVSKVALGRRPLRTFRHMEVGGTQAVLHVPIRCAGCGALLTVAPCQACYTRLVMTIDTWQKSIFHGFPRLTFRVVRLFDFLLEYLKRTQGAQAMQDFITLMSAELAAFVSAKDKREHLITSAERLFDEVVEPIDLPGPDTIVDPLLRAAIRPLVGRVYNEMIRKLEAPANAA